MFIGVYNLPGLVTLSGLVLSFLACYFSYLGNFKIAMVFFMYAGVCDLFDGLIAKRVNLSDEEKLFGVQIDSVVDMASFGIAPVIIAVHTGFSSIPDLILLFMYVCAAAMRLAYFNIHGTTAEGKLRFYTGLPVTFSAMIFPLTYAFLYIQNTELNNHLLRLVFFMVAFMFVLKIKIPKPGGIFYFLFPLTATLLTIYFIKS